MGTTARKAPQWHPSSVGCRGANQMGICASDEDYRKEYDYDDEKQRQDDAEAAEIEKKNQDLKRELQMMKRAEMRDSAYELTFTIVRKDNGKSIAVKSFGYETVAQFKNKLSRMLKDTPLLYEPILYFQGNELHDGSTFRELQMRDKSTIKIDLVEIGRTKGAVKGGGMSQRRR